MSLFREIQHLPRLLKFNLLLIGSLLIAISGLLWPHWKQNPDLSHGLFMPVLFLLLLHESRNHGAQRFLGTHPLKTATTIASLVIGLLALVASGLYAATVGWTHTLVAFSLTFATCLLFFAGLLSLSDKSVRLIPLNWTSMVAIGLWLLCAPIPPGTYTRLTLSLQLGVTEYVLTALQLLGIAASQHGNIIELSSTSVGIEEACSGVRSLISCIFAGFFFSATLVQRPWARLLIILLAAPLALLMNFVRSLTLTLLANANIDITGAWHDITGFAVLGVTAVILGGLAMLFDRNARATSSQPSPPESFENLGPLHVSLNVGLCLALLLNLFFYTNTRPSQRPEIPSPDLHKILPATPEGWHVDTSTDLYQFSGILQTENLAQRTYHKRVNGRIVVLTVYLAYWQPGQSSVSQVSLHTPDACWPGSGWEPVEIPATRETLSIPQGILPTAESRQFSNGNFSQNVWFWHIYDGRPIAFQEPRSAAELLRIAWRYGFTKESDQLFVRISCNIPWQEIQTEPVISEIVANLKPLGF